MKTSKHPKLANGQPAISCFSISQDEVVRRSNLAHERAELLAAQERLALGDKYASTAREIGEELLWHVDFPHTLRLLVCDTDLFRLTADLPSQLLAANGGQALDFYDYGYLADVLRDWLMQCKPPRERQSLRRALAWVEGRGNGLLVG